MHVGWAAVLEPPEGRAAPSFEQMRDHISRRLCRAPRYRQRLAPVPLGLVRPAWVDDDRFEIDRHVLYSGSGDLRALTDTVMSSPLSRERPLWELWITELPEGRLGMVGKVHHCMVDGIAAVELASLLLDPAPEPAAEPRRDWQPAAPPGPAQLLLDGLLSRAGEELELLASSTRTALSPGRLRGAGRSAERAVRALAHSLAPTEPVQALNAPLSPYRRLAFAGRPFKDLSRIKRAFRTTVNDVVLAVAAGAVRGFLAARGERPQRLKTMVPVNVRDASGNGELGNQITFMFLDLPCDEPDPLRRLEDIHAATERLKSSGEAEGAEAVMNLVGYAPNPIQRALSHMLASPRTFNLVVSNIPGPREPMYFLGCRLRESYPVVPLADRHALSIGFTTVADGAFFGVYADRETLPDVDGLAEAIHESTDELVGLSRRPRRVLSEA
jgi:WS/DGAT/MGAT family acyltransferase